MVFDNFAYIPMTLKNKDGVNKDKSGKALAADKLEIAPYNTYAAATETATGKHAKGDVVDPVNMIPRVVAQYYVNPANAKIDLKPGDPVNFVFHDAEWRTRGHASEDFNVTGEFLSLEDGILSVVVSVEGFPADWSLFGGLFRPTKSLLEPEEYEDPGQYLSVAALQIVKEDGSTVTSDFATVLNDYYDGLRIAEPNAVAKKHYGEAVDVHYRRANVGINKVDPEAFNDTPVNQCDKEKLEEILPLCDTVVVYNKSIDIKKIVAVHAVYGDYDAKKGLTYVECADYELSEETLENLGLTWKFEIVKNFLVGKNLTPQDEFVTLEDGIFTPRVYEDEEYARAAVGRTPIVRVTLLNGSEVIEIAYIKICIVDDDYVEPDVAYEFPIAAIKFDCEKGGTTQTTVKQMNEYYNALKVYKALFHETYPELVSLADTYNAELLKQLQNMVAQKKIKAEEAEVLYFLNQEVGTLEDVIDTEGEATHVIKWTIDADTIWESVAAGREEFWIHGTYQNDKGAQKGLFILKAPIADLAQAYDVTEPMYIPTYWNAEKTITDFNVTQPWNDDAENPKNAAENCVFVNNLNAPFSTWGIPASDADAKKQGVPGLIKLDKAITALNFFFHEQNLNRTAVGTIKNVIFEISEDGTELYATVYDKAPTKQKAVVESTNGYALYKPASGAKVVKNVDGVELKNQLIATIDNEATGTDKQTGKTFQANSITLNKDGVLAKMFLNEARTSLHVFIGAVGQVCGDEEKEVAITFKGKEYYEAEYVRPIEITDIAQDHFIDGVNGTAKGSYIEIDKLIAPKDWRNHAFGFLETQTVKEKDPATGEETEVTKQVPVGHYSYWTFYGPFEITIDKSTVRWDAEGSVKPIPLTVDVDQVESIEGVEPVAENGYMTYHNNEYVSQNDFNLYVNVRVDYGWGTINVKDLKVPVWGTKHAYED